MTNRGWSTISINWKVDITSLALALNRARKTIKRELLNGSVLDSVSDVPKPQNGFIYSANKSEFIKKQKQEKKCQCTKIEKDMQLKNFVIDNLQFQSLKAIAGRSKLLQKQGALKNSITAKTLYNFVFNKNIDFINESRLFRVKKKQKYREKCIGKRANGTLIDERPDIINKKQRIGDFEMDLIEGSRVNLKYLLVLVDRKTKLTIIRLINDKKSQTINLELRNLQKTGRLVFWL